jgi:iron complex outermembrane receptor protein
MSAHSRSLSFLLFAALALPSRSQTSSPATTPASKAEPDHVQHLDRFVVSAGHDPKTSFDVAQGTSVLAGEELHRLVQATLGDTLSSTPGVSSTYYGPGSSRPVIRGMGGDRVRVLDNGVGALDASNVSPDHNTAVEPLFASRIEVLRGPSTLLYGSSAVGGAVNVIDNAIPDTAPDGKAHGAIELRGGGATRERAAVASVGGGAGKFATQLNLLKQRTRDVRIPGVARIDDDAPAGQLRGILPNSASDTASGSLGGTYFWTRGHAGAAVSRHETDYGVPTGDDPATSIRMQRTRLDLNADLTQPFGSFQGAKARFGLGDYQHSELSGASTVNTTFTNKAWEGRIEAAHEPIGNVTGTVGAQAARSDFAARGEEVATPPSITQSAALFALEELAFGKRATLQLGLRYEGQRITLGEVDAGRSALAGYGARSGQEKKFAGASSSLGLVVYPAKDWSIATALAYSNRIPTAQELFSNGPHGGTAAYEVGTTGLRNERCFSFDLSVRRRAGFVTGSVGVFANQFSDYIYERELPADVIPATLNADGLTPYQFVATDARFHGAEVELLFHLLEKDTRRVHLELNSDYVRATNTITREPLPRITPQRIGARLSYEDGRWHAVMEVRHAMAQRRITLAETPTDGYTLLNASLGLLLPGKRVSYELFARARNLTDVTAREHSSYLKDLAPLPGRGLLAGVRMTF